MSDRNFRWAMIQLVATLVIIGLVAALHYRNYNECRAFGHSFWYCVASR